VPFDISTEHEEWSAAMSSIDEGDRILDGQIDYERVFVTFTRHTEQKIAHGLIFESLLHALKERGVVLMDGKPTTLVDLGCGEGHTAYEMIAAINRAHPQGDGVNYYGLDADERFVRSTKRLLLEIKGPQRLRVINVRRANLLGGEPLPIASIDDVLVTMGHVLYYAYSPKGADETRKRIAGIIDRIIELLGRDGLCLLVHSAQNCPLATLRASVADSVEAKPPRIVADVADEKRFVVMSLIAPYQLCFPRLTPEQWDKTKEPACYRVESSNNTQFVAALELLTFVAQRGLKSLAQEGKLGRFVDELKAQLDGDAVLHGLSDYQLLLSQRQSSELKEYVEAALQQAGQSLDRIGREARRAFALQTKETAVLAPQGKRSEPF
jgi:SAM-dependent methyltransferase